MEKSNIDRLQQVVDGLQDLGDKVVFVGGTTVRLYASDTAAVELRATMDVDCVVELFSYSEYEAFGELLRQRRFYNDISSNAPICRWVYQDVIVDIMPDDENILGFSNQWYKPGFDNREKYELPSGKIIYILPVTYFVATKLDAVVGRGGNDLRISHDFEDLIYVLNYCPEFKMRLRDAEENIKEHIKCHFQMLLNRINIREEIECVLPIGEEERVDYIIEILKL